jgi:FO synthase
VAALADELRAAVSGDVVTYVRNRNINYTNVCTFRCAFCGFSKGPLTLNLRGTPYLLTLDQLAERVAEAAALGATEVCLQGGIHPDFDGNYYFEVTRAAATAVPGMHLHGFTALEVTEGARRLGEPLAQYLVRLKHAGLGSLPGTAAEILDDEVRATLCPDKISTQQWLDCHETAHGIGLRSNVTMMFGSIERPVHVARHLLRTADLQRRTGGFTEFVGLPFVHMAAPIYLKRAGRRGPTWREVVLVHAVARIVYHGLIDHVQASWVKLGTAGVRQLLAAGVDDLGGTLMEENISRAAGATHGQLVGESELQTITKSMGRVLCRRDTLYQLLDTGPAPVTDR